MCVVAEWYNKVDIQTSLSVEDPFGIYFPCSTLHQYSPEKRIDDLYFIKNSSVYSQNCTQNSNVCNGPSSDTHVN